MLFSTLASLNIINVKAQEEVRKNTLFLKMNMHKIMIKITLKIIL